MEDGIRVNEARGRSDVQNHLVTGMDLPESEELGFRPTLACGQR